MLGNMTGHAWHTQGRAYVHVNEGIDIQVSVLHQLLDAGSVPHFKGNICRSAAVARRQTCRRQASKDSGEKEEKGGGTPFQTTVHDRKQMAHVKSPKHKLSGKKNLR